MKKQHKRNLYRFYLLSGGLIGVLVALLLTARPVLAQGMMEQLVAFMKEKIGFVFNTQNSGFVFTRVTPNYTAFAGDMATAGGHRIRIDHGTSAIDFSFAGATDSAAPASAPGIVHASDRQILTQAEDILLKNSSDSGRIASVSADERLILDQADALLGATDSAGLTQEQKDYLLLVRLQSEKVSQLSNAVDTQLAVIKNEARDILSKAKLTEDTNERKVVFPGIARGTDMAYRLDEGGIKQEIIIASHTDTNDIFTFNLEALSLSFKDIGNNVWYFYDASGSAVFRLPKAWATDAKKSFTNDVYQTIQKYNNTIQYIITVPDSWLRATGRVYPVIIHTALEVIPEKREATGITK